MTFKTFASRKISAASMLMAAATMALGGAIAIGAGAANQGMPGAAGKAVGVRIATVDLAQITHHLDSEVAMHQHFATELKSLQAKIKAKRKELRSLDEPLNPDSTISFKPGSEEYDAQRRKLLKASVQLQVFQQYHRLRLQEEQRLDGEKTYRQINQAIAEYAKAHHIALVLAADEAHYNFAKSSQLIEEVATRKVLYASGSLDITNNVIHLMNREYQKKHGQ